MRTMMTIAVFTLGLGVSTASADKLSDFKDADRYQEGCVTIPVSYSERSNCESEGPHVHEWCDGSSSKPVSCGSEEETKKPKRDIENAKSKIEDLKRKRDEADRNRSNATTEDDKRKYEEEIKKIDDDLYETKKVLEAAEKALDERKKLVDDAIYNLDHCISSRQAVMNIFAYALDKMRHEDETPEIRDVARSLLGKYQDSKDGHQKQIENKTNAINNCKSWRP